jgi:hypothetical protein
MILNPWILENENHERHLLLVNYADFNKKPGRDKRTLFASSVALGAGKLLHFPGEL